MTKPTKRRSTSDHKLRKQAIELLRDPQFLFRAGTQLGEMGIVGEKPNRLIIFLATLTIRLGNPVSVLVKGPSSSGKSNLVRTVLQLLPAGTVVERTSLSPKALAHGSEELKARVLYLTEQRGGKDAQLLLRLLQSEGIVKHEYATVTGGSRSTQLAERKGSPVVITTTTEDQIFEDDETRFLSLWVDHSGRQTRAILRAEAKSAPASNKKTLRVFQQGIQILLEHKATCEIPKWFGTVANYVPVHVRSRRDWPRFLNFCKSIALTRIYSSGHEGHSKVEVNLSDYSVAYYLLNPVFSSTASKMPPSTYAAAVAVSKIFHKTRRSVSINEIRKRLDWEKGATYKHAKLAVNLGLLKYDPTIRPNNEKRFLPRRARSRRNDFLPSPRRLLKLHPELKSCKYIDPISGEEKTIRRKIK